MRAPMEQEIRQPIGARFYLNAIRKRKKDNTNPDFPQQKYAQPECALRLRRRGAKALRGRGADLHHFPIP